MFSSFFRETFIILNPVPAAEDTAVHKIHSLTIKLYDVYERVIETYCCPINCSSFSSVNIY